MKRASLCFRILCFGSSFAIGGATRFVVPVAWPGVLAALSLVPSADCRIGLTWLCVSLVGAAQNPGPARGDKWWVGVQKLVKRLLPHNGDWCPKSLKHLLPFDLCAALRPKP